MHRQELDLGHDAVRVVEILEELLAHLALRVAQPASMRGRSRGGRALVRVAKSVSGRSSARLACRALDKVRFVTEIVPGPFYV